MVTKSIDAQQGQGAPEDVPGHCLGSLALGSVAVHAAHPHIHLQPAHTCTSPTRPQEAPRTWCKRKDYRTLQAVAADVCSIGVGVQNLHISGGPRLQAAQREWEAAGLRVCSKGQAGG